MEKEQNSSTFVISMENDQDMNKVPEIDESQFQDNPFAQELSIPVTKIISDIDYSETTEGILVNKTLYCETTKKVELYIHESSYSNVAGLSDKAQRLYLHILYSLKRNKDYLYLNKEYYMKKNNVKSQTTYNAAVKELHRYKFIVPSHVKGWYYVNPHRFYPGSRVNRYKDRIRVTATWDKTE